MWLSNWSQKFGQSYDRCATLVQQGFLLLRVYLKYVEPSWDENDFLLHLCTQYKNPSISKGMPISQSGSKYFNDNMLQDALKLPLRQMVNVS